MGSEESDVRPNRLAWIKHGIYANMNRPYVIVSLSLFLFIYFTMIHRDSNVYSPYVKKRYGVGAGDTHTGELASVLRRKQEGRAAVAIIRVRSSSNKDSSTQTSNNKDDVQYLVQLKSHDYPIEKFRGAACLLGGNAKREDASPLETLKRELNEELHFLDWIGSLQESNVIDDSALQNRLSVPLRNSTMRGHSLHPGTVRFLGATLHSQTAEIIQKKNPYAFTCALYEITLETHQLPNSIIYPRGANVQEGRVVLLSEDQMIQHSKYAWGYEYTMQKYFGRTTVNKQKGTSVTNIEVSDWKKMVWTPIK